MAGLNESYNAPNGSETLFFNGIMGDVRKMQPQIVMGGEDWASYDDVIKRNAQLGGRKGGFAGLTQQAVLDKDLSTIEPSVSSTDGAALTCYLHPGLDGQQPGGCPTLTHRSGENASALWNGSVGAYRMWVAVEAASGVISEHQISTCGVWNKPNMDVDPFDETESPLWAFQKHRALSRIALRTKLPIASYARRGVLVYLKHDSMGPNGDAAIVIFNPGDAQTINIDLPLLPAPLLDGGVLLHDLFGGANATMALNATWVVPMRAGEMKAFAGFSLGVFAPRQGKKTNCAPDDGFAKTFGSKVTLQECFMFCQKDHHCENVFVKYVDVPFTEPAPPVACTLLGVIADPAKACKDGTGTLVKKLVSRPGGGAGRQTSGQLA